MWSSSAEEGLVDALTAERDEARMVARLLRRDLLKLDTEMPLDDMRISAILAEVECLFEWLKEGR
jgi:hypothetical protein